MAGKPPPKLPASLSLHAEAPRSQRYEYDENIAFSPPSSSHMFKIFDSSEIFARHPRKYPILASQDDSSSACSSSGSSTAIAHPGLHKKRSKSLAACDLSSADYANLLEKAHPSLKDNKTTNMPSALPPPTESKERPASAPVSPTRRSSVAVMERTGIGGVSPSRPDLKSGLPMNDEASSYPKDSETGQLSKMFRVAFGTSSSWHNKKESSFQEADEDSFGGTTSSTKTQQEDVFVFPPTNEPSTSSSNETQGMVAVTVLPEPRRLFGFGPQYQPPAETVLVPVDQSKSFTTGSRSLVDKVNRAGITAVDGPGGSPSKPRFGRGLLSGTTKEEINTWAPFST